MAGVAPAHLVARLNAIGVHVFELAQDRDPEGKLTEHVEAVREKVGKAMSSRSEVSIAEAMSDLRALARKLSTDKNAPASPQKHAPAAGAKPRAAKTSRPATSRASKRRAQRDSAA